MRYAWIIATFLLVAQLPVSNVDAQQAANTPRPVYGLVTQIDTNTDTVVIDRTPFFVPAGVYNLAELEEGVWALVGYEISGNTFVATSMEIDRTVD